MGIIRFGKSTGRYHLSYIMQRENIEVGMIYNHKEKAEMNEYCEKHGIAYTAHLHKLLAHAV